MSTSEPKHTYTADEVKAEVRQTISQLSELTRTDVSFDEFCQTVLTKIVKLTGGHGAVLWQSVGNGPPRITHKAGHQSVEIPVENAPHSISAAQVIESKATMYLSSQSIENDQNPLPDGIPYLLLFAPVFNRKKICCGALQLLQRHNISDSARDGYLKFLARIAELFPRWHENHELSRLTQNAESITSTMDFITQVHHSIDFETTVYSIANESRRLLAADRVSVAKWNGSNCKVVAVSSQDKFDNRANVIRKLGNVATSSVSTETPFWITGDMEGIAPNIVRKINDYMDESHCRTLAVIPLLKRPEEDVEAQFNPARRQKPKRLGALIVEFFDAEVTQEQISDACGLVVQQSEIALNNAMDHNEIFLLPLWTRLGRLQNWLLKDHYSKTMTALGAVVLIALLLTFFPKELEMRVSGVLQPTVRKNVFAQSEGIIRDVFVDHGSIVDKDQPLMQIENDQLDLQISTAENDLNIANEQIGANKAKINRVTDPREIDQVSIELGQLRIQKEGLLKNLKLLKEKRESQLVKAPIAGTVLTWENKKRNTNRMVRANDHVIAIGQKQGAWQLELEIPENQIAYVKEARKASNGEPLPVTFRVSTNPNLTLDGKLVYVSERAEISQKSGTLYFRATVEIDKSKLGAEDLRSGAGVTARLQCGQTSLGFTYFYQVIDYLRTKVFF